MKLGLKRDEVRIVEYTSEWSKEFNRVKKEIIDQTQIDESRIEQIGSTAIKGMAAKPIIDIIVGVDDLSKVDDSLLAKFAKAGFLRLRVEKPGEIILAKFTDDTYEIKTHYIHIVEFKKELWNNLLFFRDYLNSNETAKQQYLELKLAYLEKSTTGIKEYTDSKEEFVINIYKKRTGEK